MLEKAGDVCGLYLNPPENAVVWSVDEKSGMQAKCRVNPKRPPVPGIPTRREFEYRRHGTAVLFAGLGVHEGSVAGWVTDSTCSDNFVAFLGDLVDQTPAGLDLHCIVDNLSAHTTPKVEAFLEANPHVHLTSRRPMRPGSTSRAVLLHPQAAPAPPRRVRLRRPANPTDHCFHQRLQPTAAPFRWTHDGRPLMAA